MPTRILSLVQPVTITDPDDPRVALYRDVRDRDLQSRAGLFMAEGRFVVAMVLAQTRFTPHSVLVTEPALQSIQSTLKSIGDATPVYLASQEVMDAITGFHIHRGCLAAVHRGDPLDAGTLIALAWFTATHDMYLDEALAAAERATRLAPEDGNILDTLAEVHYRRGDAKQAIEVETRALTMSPDDAYLKEQIARGDTTKAKSWLGSVR